VTSLLNRDSPDESETGINVRVFPALLQDRREVLTATSTSVTRTLGRGSDLAIFPGIWTHSFCRLLLNDTETSHCGRSSAMSRHLVVGVSDKISAWQRRRCYRSGCACRAHAVNIVQDPPRSWTMRSAYPRSGGASATLNCGANTLAAWYFRRDLTTPPLACTPAGARSPASELPACRCRCGHRQACWALLDRLNQGHCSIVASGSRNKDRPSHAWMNNP